ncbi:MAG: hypothetical protein AAGI69_26195, partial [Cyanobacteria bacterium P01_H01_bin.21]
MVYQVIRWLHQWLVLLGQRLKVILRIISGQQRRENQQLLMRLAILRGDYNNLKKELDELIEYSDREIAQLKG